MLSGREIDTGANVCNDHAKLMTHISLGNSVAGERHLGFPSRYVGVLFAYFDYLLESFGFKTCKFGGSHGSKITSSKPVVFSLFVLFVLVLFRLYFFLGTKHCIGLVELATTLKY